MSGLVGEKRKIPVNRRNLRAGRAFRRLEESAMRSLLLGLWLVCAAFLPSSADKPGEQPLVGMPVLDIDFDE
jgi:hypothetical protein